jgi:hypothetical protein
MAVAAAAAAASPLVVAVAHKATPPVKVGLLLFPRQNLGCGEELPVGADEELGGAPKRRVRNPDLKKHDNDHDHGESIKREKQKKKKEKDELKRRAQD